MGPLLNRAYEAEIFFGLTCGHELKISVGSRKKFRNRYCIGSTQSIRLDIFIHFKSIYESGIIPADITKVISSPLLRARQTATLATGKFNQYCKVFKYEIMNNRCAKQGHFGKFEKKLIDQFGDVDFKKNLRTKPNFLNFTNQPASKISWY